ncbi:hypothetical protein A2U01_0072983, partial [Trifolium medium]|nr:hypothetical protein [Trifolium medium]
SLKLSTLISHGSHRSGIGGGPSFGG